MTIVKLPATGADKELLEWEISQCDPRDRLPGQIRKCQRDQRTQALKEFMSRQGIVLLDRNDLQKRGWTRRMTQHELRGMEIDIWGAPKLYRLEHAERAEDRGEIAETIRLNLLAREKGDIGHQGPVSGLTQRRDPNSGTSRRRREFQDMRTMMSNRPEGGGPLWARRS